jgi:hypothetical protein
LKIHLKHYALKALATAKEDLRRDGYLIPVAFVIADDGILDFNVQFEGKEHKRSVYAKVVEIAKERNARAIITVNDAGIKNDLVSKNLQPTGEATATEMLNECIYVTVSGPTIKTWTVSVSYERTGSEIRFHRGLESSDNPLFGRQFLTLAPSIETVPL